jgi:hypothetical protein
MLAARLGERTDEGDTSAQILQICSNLRLRQFERPLPSLSGPESAGRLSPFQMEEMIDPRVTLRLICLWVENAWWIVS